MPADNVLSLVNQPTNIYQEAVGQLLFVLEKISRNKQHGSCPQEDDFLGREIGQESMNKWRVIEQNIVKNPGELKQQF